MNLNVDRTLGCDWGEAQVRTLLGCDSLVGVTADSQFAELDCETKEHVDRTLRSKLIEQIVIQISN